MQGKVVALSGGVGGAKLALGLSRVLAPGQLTIIANTGDDFRHLGLSISPDIDTLLYTLSGLADPERGWGVRDESWNFMEAMARLGGETWFRLGDRDLATHVERTRLLSAGISLSAVTDNLRERLGIACRIVPMTDAEVRTQLLTDEGWLDFQHYFVRLHCEPAVREIRYCGAELAEPAPAVLEALGDPHLQAVVICPSNPMLSVDPILAIPALRSALLRLRVPIVAVSPIIGGAAVRGPTAKLMREFGFDSSASAVARRYAGIVRLFVVDREDAEAAMPPGMERVVAATLMRSLQDREDLARAVLAAALG